MSVCIMKLVAWGVLALITVPALAQSSAKQFSAPPDGFDVHRDGIDRGKIELIEYDSTTVGIRRPVA